MPINLEAAMQRMQEAENAGPDLTDARLMILSDGRAGHENQSLGVAEMLGFKDPEVLTLHRVFTSRWLGWLPVSYVFENYERIREMTHHADLVIGTGYVVSRVLRALKKENPRLFTVALMKPSGRLKDYDVVAVPQHDGVKKAENVVVTLGAANRITRERLQLEGDRWKKRLMQVPSPRLAVLIGGASKRSRFGAKQVQEMLLPLLDMARQRNMGVFITTSRRTGAEATAAAEALLANTDVKHFFWKPDDPTQRDNPYLAFLALAEAVVVTPESVSMVCEAATAGRPVYLFGTPRNVAPKFRLLFAAMAKQGRLKWWDGQFNLRTAAAGMMDTLMIAGFIRARWNKRNQESGTRDRD